MKPQFPTAEACKEREAFLEQLRQETKERVRVVGLIRQFKENMPLISALWDTGPGSIRHNRVNDAIRECGFAIYCCAMDEFWAGLSEPAIYDADTLWTEAHTPEKIAKVFEAWKKGRRLSPLVLQRHEDAPGLYLVVDGKHRLTVARAVAAPEMPFMVAIDDDGVNRIFPSARLICRMPQPSR